MKLKDRVAVVTGASRGIGSCIARRFAAEGATVAVVARESQAAADRVAQEIVSNGGMAKGFQADLTRIHECKRLAAEVLDTFGAVDILVNNAGVFSARSIEETTEDIWDSQLNLNLKGAFFLTQALVPHMKEKRRGKIINVTSIAGVGDSPIRPPTALPRAVSSR
ncbi:MAG: SDR family NAD(P)-dependent oxidoreductase [Thermoleophilia bacterium]|nr:SDR family NAD(P)-dependent oxidoreductase [Thermoleophilia bacterium]